MRRRRPCGRRETGSASAHDGRDEHDLRPVPVGSRPPRRSGGKLARWAPSGRWAMEDWDDWSALWAGYLAFYRAELRDETSRATFERLCVGDDAMFGLLAVDDAGHGIGLANCVVHPSTWSRRPKCYLEDLFVAPTSRGADVGRALLMAVKSARDRAWGRRRLLAHPAVQRSGPLALRHRGAADVFRGLRDVTRPGRRRVGATRLGLRRGSCPSSAGGRTADGAGIELLPTISPDSALDRTHRWASCSAARPTPVTPLARRAGDRDRRTSRGGRSLDH